MDIYKVLKAEHVVVKDLLKKLDETTEKSRKERTSLFSQLKEALIPHARAEEQVLYEALKAAKVEKALELGFEGYEEHAVADHLIKELEATKTEDKRWGALLCVLKENIEHHIKEEEGPMFTQAQKVFSAKRAEDMAVNFISLKEVFVQELNSGESLDQPPSHSIN